MAKNKLIPCPRVDKIMDVNSGHMTEDDDRILKSKDCRAIVYKYCEGFFVYVGLPEDDAFAGFSKEFQTIIKEARRLGCKFVCFDCDGEIYEELPKFDW